MNIEFSETLARDIHAVLDGKIINEHVPEEPVGPHEKCVGVVSNLITRSLFSLLVRVDKYIENYKIRLNTSKKICVDDLVHLQKMEYPRDTIIEAITSCLRGEFPQLLKMNVVIEFRQGWKIVIVKSAQQFDIPRIAESFLPIGKN